VIIIKKLQNPNMVHTNNIINLKKQRKRKRRNVYRINEKYAPPPQSATASQSLHTFLGQVEWEAKPFLKNVNI
jgi:hypothetical protein